MTRILLALALLLGCASLGAQPVTHGEPVAGSPVQDRDFRVSTRQFGLERAVEMYQWRAAGDGDQRVWNGAWIDSSQFPAGHQNPPAAAIGGQRWWSQDATIDGKPIDASVLRTLGTWQRFRPDFARLPANLAASFQPEGDGLGSSDNPLAPQIGDLRVHWRELALPALAGKLEMRDGVWHLTREAAVAPVRTERLIELPDDPQVQAGTWLPWLGGALVLAIGLWLSLRRRRGQRDE